jgi:hypothetical protein
MPASDEDPPPMDRLEQAEHFANELEALVKRYSEEYDLTTYEIVGLLHTETFSLCHRAFMANELDDEDETEDDE